MKSVFRSCCNYTAHLHESASAALEIYHCAVNPLFLSLQKVTTLDISMMSNKIYYLDKLFQKNQHIICRNGTINYIFQTQNINHKGIRNISY